MPANVTKKMAKPTKDPSGISELSKRQQVLRIAVGDYSRRGILSDYTTVKSAKLSKRSGIPDPAGFLVRYY